MRRWRRPAVLFALLASCDRPASEAVPRPAAHQPVPGATAALDRAALDRLADGARTVNGRSQDADATSEWQAALVDGRLVRITEAMQRGDYASSQLRHYFVNGLHRATEERRIAVMLNPNAASTRDTIVIEITWEDTGRAASTRKTINGAPATVQPYEVSEVRTHVAMIAQQALVRGGR